MVCGNFILPEPASYVFFYAIFNLRNLFYLIVGNSWLQSLCYDSACEQNAAEHCSYHPFHKNHPLPRVLGRLFLLLPNRRGKGYPFLQLFAKISYFVVSTKYTLSAMCRMSS